VRVDRFSSTHFRNLEHDPISFSARVNVLVGPNGHGKTNLLEAIQFFQFGRSFRTSRETDLIRFGEPFCRVELRAATERGDGIDLVATIERDGTKRIKIDGNDVAKYSDMIARYPCVMFGPQDLALTSGEPAERRRFVDILGSVTEPGYLDVLRRYRRVLTQRNAALKSRGSADVVAAWTEELVQSGCDLTERRLALTETVRARLQSQATVVGVRYAVDIGYESELLRGRREDVGCADLFWARLAEAEPDERRRGLTLVGPHRDDVKLVANGRDLRRYGSQGERRLFAILLRLSELSHIEERLREPCVLLLDDVFSELDETITERLKRWLDDGRQIFVTSPVRLDWGGRDARLFRVLDGRIEASTANGHPQA
jgi:DNA replication and repair protein RecF